MNEMSSYVENLFSKKTNFMVSKSFPQTIDFGCKIYYPNWFDITFFDSGSGPEFVKI